MTTGRDSQMSKVADAVDHPFYQPMNKCLKAQRIQIEKAEEAIKNTNKLLKQGRYDEAKHLTDDYIKSQQFKRDDYED